MCLILDANRAARAVDPSDPDHAPIHRWLDGAGVLRYSVALARELDRTEAVRRWLVALRRAGKAVLAAEAAVQHELAVVDALPKKSNDAHILALARESGARTLCTDDQALMDDFRDRTLVPDPRGAIYRTASHRRLLKHTCAPAWSQVGWAGRSG